MSAPKPTDFRKNCQLNLRVNVPQGFDCSIAQTDYRGFGHLERGASGVQQAGYYFQGMSDTRRKTHSWKGPLSDDWQAIDKVEVAAGTSDPKKTTSFMSMDSTDGSIETKYHFSWKRCP